MKRLALVFLAALAGCSGGGGGGDGSGDSDLILGSREAPVSVGVEHGYQDGLSFIVLSSVQNANNIVFAENQFNDPPAPGKQFFLARVRVTNSGTFTEYDPSFDLDAIGSRGQAYRTFTDSCGVIPDDCFPTEIAAGGSYECNLCWQVGSDEASTMLMFRDSGAIMEQTGEPFFFDLVP